MRRLGGIIALLLLFCLPAAIGAIWHYPAGTATAVNATGALTSHLASNALVPYAPDLVLLARDLALPDWVPTIGYLSLFLLGVTAFLNALRTPVIDALLASLLLSMLIAFFIGDDPLVLGAIAWCPWLAWASERYLSGRLIYLIAIVFFELRVAEASGALAIISNIFALSLVALFGQAARSLRSPRPVATILLIAALGSYLAMAGLPPVWQFDYPRTAHVVSDDALPGIIRPLIGPDTPIPIIARTAIKQGLSAIALASLLLSVLLLVLTWRSPLRVASWIGLLCSAALAIDTLLPDWISTVGPLASTTRIVPGSFLFPLALLMVPAWATLFTITVTLERRWSLGLGVCAVLIVATILGRDQLVAPLLIPPSAQQLQANLEAGGFSQEESKRIIVSPSSYLVMHVDPKILNQNRTHLPSWASARSFVQWSAASENSDRVAMAFDGNPETRWNISGVRSADSWFAIGFKEPLQLHRISLGLGKFFTDFPGSIQLRSATTCPSSGTNLSPELFDQVIAESPIWEGPLRFTARGLPYFGDQSVVEKSFAPQFLSCILIAGRPATTGYDWSIAEIELALD